MAATLRHAVARGLDDPTGHLEEKEPHPTDTHPLTRQRLAALGRTPEPALLAEVATTPTPEALLRLGAYFAKPDALCRAATDDFLAVARADARVFQEELEAVAAEVGHEELVLHENTRGGDTFVIAGGVLFVLLGLSLMTFDIHGLDTTEERIVGGFAITAGLSLAAHGAALLRRGDRPFLILRRREMMIPGLNTPIAWEHMADLDMTLHQGRVITRLLLPPGALFPARVPGSRRVKLDPKRRIVTLTAGTPHGMKAQDLAELIACYRRAVEARRLLAAEGAPTDPTAGAAGHDV